MKVHRRDAAGAYGMYEALGFRDMLRRETPHVHGLAKDHVGRVPRLVGPLVRAAVRVRIGAIVLLAAPPTQFSCHLSIVILL